MVDNLATDREPQTSAGGLVRQGIANLLEGVEYTLLIFWSDAHSRVSHGDQNSGVVVLGVELGPAWPVPGATPVPEKST